MIVVIYELHIQYSYYLDNSIKLSLRHDRNEFANKARLNIMISRGINYTYSILRETSRVPK